MWPFTRRKKQERGAPVPGAYPPLRSPVLTLSDDDDDPLDLAVQVYMLEQLLSMPPQIPAKDELVPFHSAPDKINPWQETPNAGTLGPVSPETPQGNSRPEVTTHDYHHDTYNHAASPISDPSPSSYPSTSYDSGSSSSSDSSSSSSDSSSSSGDGGGGW